MEEITITDYLHKELIKLELKSKNKNEVLKEISELIYISEDITDKDEVLAALEEREEIGSTGVGKGVAIPHAKLNGAKKLVMAFGISRESIDFKSLDGEKVKIFFIFASPKNETRLYLKVLARVSRLIRGENFRNKLLQCKTTEDVIKAIKEEENQ